VHVAGAGMAGLVAAARGRQLGLAPVVLEKGTRPGGSMLLSSCVIWRHRSFDDFRSECPGGDERLQRLIWERLDDGLAWLESLGASVVTREPGNPLTSGMRFEPRGLTDALARAAGEIRLETPCVPRDTKSGGPLVLATGGFPVRLAAERGLLARANPWSDGGGIDYARERGAALTGGLEEFYGRALPGPVAEELFVSAAQLYGRFARRVNDRGEEFFPGEPSWSENDLAQAIARQPGGRAWYVLDERALQETVRERTVAEMVEQARAAGGEVVPVEGGGVKVRVYAAVTHTLGGLRVDTGARVLDEEGEPISGLYAAGVDAGGVALGGYASGLAQALVLGLVAAESASA
jgi:fumarate reductase flavoprotein subunit